MSDLMSGYSVSGSAPAVTVGPVPPPRPARRCRDCPVELVILDRQGRCVTCALKGQRDDWKAKAEDRDRVMAVRARDYHAACKDRDDARLEADRLRAELARIAKERDDTTSALRDVRFSREWHSRMRDLANEDRHKVTTELEKLKAERAGPARVAVATATSLRPIEMRAEGDALLAVPLRQFLAALPAGSSVTFRARD